MRDIIFGRFLGEFNLSALIKNEPNKTLEAVINDDLLSATERESFLKEIFETHRRDKTSSGFLGFFQPASTSQLSDENYGKLCYRLGSQLYETEKLKKYPEKIEEAKVYYRQVPEGSYFYREAMSDLYDLETIGITEKLSGQMDEEALSNERLNYRENFFKEKGIDRGHQALDAYNDSVQHCNNQ